MRAAWYERQGPANEVLIVGEMPDPRPGAGEVRIRIAASGVERVQWIKYSEIMYTIRRFYP
jgi:NADPH:quinone reductase-like Zn-dependent oxidoreductase